MDLRKFDILGAFELDDNTGIEPIVTPLNNGKFLSRKISYYYKVNDNGIFSARSCKECSFFRKKFKDLLTQNLSSEKKFCIVD